MELSITLLAFASVFFFVCFVACLQSLKNENLYALKLEKDKLSLAARLDESKAEQHELDKYIKELAVDNAKQQQELLNAIKREAELTRKVAQLDDAVLQLNDIISMRRDAVISGLTEIVEAHDCNVDDIFPGDGL